MPKISGIALGSVAVGSIFVYAGITGRSVLQSIQAVIQGKSPQTTPANAVPISGGTTVTSSVTSTGGTVSNTSNAQNKALGKLMAASYGWNTGEEWTALDNLVMSESGWSDTILNGQGSGAAGIAQKITGFDSSYQSGNAQQQIAWLLSYIKGRYGDPVTAWNFHLANNWY